MAAAADKAALRAEALRRRAAVRCEVRLALAETLARVGLALALGRAQRSAVSLFLPIRGEPDTLPLARALAAAGLSIALPVTPPRGEPLLFRAWAPGEPLAPGRFGTSEPPPSAVGVEPDLLFVPLAAADRRGDRLGYGAGYYDGALRRLRRLRRLRARGPVLAVGVAFAAQLFDAVPAEPHDERLDALVTEDGLITFGG